MHSAALRDFAWLVSSSRLKLLLVPFSVSPPLNTTTDLTDVLPSLVHFSALMA